MEPGTEKAAHDHQVIVILFIPQTRLLDDCSVLSISVPCLPTNRAA